MSLAFRIEIVDVLAEWRWNAKDAQV